MISDKAPELADFSRAAVPSRLFMPAFTILFLRGIRLVAAWHRSCLSIAAQSLVVLFFLEPDDIGNTHIFVDPCGGSCDHGRPRRLPSGYRRPSQAFGGCLGHGTAADAPNAQVFGDSGEAHGCAEMQVLRGDARWYHHALTLINKCSPIALL